MGYLTSATLLQCGPSPSEKLGCDGLCTHLRHNKPNLSQINYINPHFSGLNLIIHHFLRWDHQFPMVQGTVLTPRGPPAPVLPLGAAPAALPCTRLPASAPAPASPRAKSPRQLTRVLVTNSSGEQWPNDWGSPSSPFFQGILDCKPSSHGGSPILGTPGSQWAEDISIY